MSNIQSNIHLSHSRLLLKLPNARPEKNHCSLSQSSYLRATCLYVSTNHNYKVFPRLSYSATKYKRCAPACVYVDGRRNSENANHDFYLDSLKKAVKKLQEERSVLGFLRKQMQECQSNGNGGGRPPWGFGGGSGGSEGEYFARIMDELLQVVLATISFIFMYIFIVRGEELTRLGVDYIRYLCGAQSSTRLRRAMGGWRKFCQSITGKKLEMNDDEPSLVREDGNTSPGDWLE